MFLYLEIFVKLKQKKEMKEMENKQIAENIKRLCTKKGITINQMAKELNINSSFISEMKNKDRTPSIKRIEEIAKYFGISIDYLIGTMEEPTGIDQLINNEISKMNQEQKAKLLADIYKNKKGK